VTVVVGGARTGHGVCSVRAVRVTPPRTALLRALSVPCHPRAPRCRCFQTNLRPHARARGRVRRLARARGDLVALARAAPLARPVESRHRRRARGGHAARHARLGCVLARVRGRRSWSRPRARAAAAADGGGGAAAGVVPAARAAAAARTTRGAALDSDDGPRVHVPRHGASAGRGAWDAGGVGRGRGRRRSATSSPATP